MERTVIFVRNGETKDYVLTDLGGVQARCVADYLNDMLTKNSVKLVNIYSSSDRHSINTAMCLVNKLGVPLNISESLHEYTTSDRKIDGIPVDVSFHNFKDRVHKVMGELKLKLDICPTSPIIVYTNALFISYAMSSLTRTLEDMEHFNDKSFNIHIPNCSVSTIVYNQKTSGWTIGNISCVAHLGNNISDTVTDIALS